MKTDTERSRERERGGRRDTRSQREATSGRGEKRGGKGTEGQRCRRTRRGQEEQNPQHTQGQRWGRDGWAASESTGEEPRAGQPVPALPHLPAVVAFPEEELVLDDALLPRGAPGQRDAGLRPGLGPQVHGLAGHCGGAGRQLGVGERPPRERGPTC